MRLSQTSAVGRPTGFRVLKAMVLLFCLCFSFGLKAQQITVTGTVVDNLGESLPGVSVTLKSDSKVGTATDLDGRYSIKAAPGQVLNFSYIGFAPQSVTIPANGRVDVMLKQETNALDEVVVIGYGQVKKKDVLGAITSVSADELENRKNGNALEALRGLTSGISITSSGQAGSESSVRIRGLGSFTSNDPLFIIDGAYASADLGLNVEDIESIQVLKDASSASIYGSRAANGVVIITTKKGQNNGLKVTFDSQIKVNWLPRYDLMDAETYKKFDDRAYQEAILLGVPGVTSLQGHYGENCGNTDWQDEMLRTGCTQNYNLALSGGVKDINFYVSLNRQKMDAPLKYTGFDKYGFRVNTSGKKGIFSFGENLFYSKRHTDHLNGIANVWSTFIGMPPTINVYDPNHFSGFGYGDNTEANTYTQNPVAMQELENAGTNAEYIAGNIFGQLEWPSWARAKLNVAYKSANSNYDKLRKTGSWVMGQGNDAAYLNWQHSRYQDLLIEQTYEFFHKFGKHDINALFGISWNKYKSEAHAITRQNPLMNGDEYLLTISAAQGTTSASGSYGEYGLISYFGRINYSFDDRYLLQVTGRRDGTSKLPAAKRWGNFFSGSLGWRISQEKFFTADWVNDLKLRVNYGTLGNSNIGNWDYLSSLNTAIRAILGAPVTEYAGTTQSNIVNTNLVWEKKTTFNIGVDFTAFNSRFRASAEWFSAKSKDLLYRMPVLVSSGNEGSAPYVNAGSMVNKGIEIELGWNDRIGSDFNYNVSLNLTHVKNKVLELGYNQPHYLTSTSISKVGEPLGMFYMYKMLGVFQNQEEIDNYKTWVVDENNAEGGYWKTVQPNARPGDIKYDDYNKDGQITSEDRQVVGNPWPKLEMGLNLGASYKGFDLSINTYGRFGMDVYNGSRATAGDFGTNNNNFNGYKPWTQECPSLDTPRMIYGDSTNSRGDQDRWLEDGSFWRIADITLGYSLPYNLIHRIGLEKLRFAVTGQNLVTATSYKGLDPEFNNSGVWSLGYDGCSHPNPRAVQFALSLTF